MPKNQEIRVKVTKNQLERIKNNCQAKGFRFVSSYIRFLCLEHNKYIEDKIIENNKILNEIEKKLIRN